MAICGLTYQRLTRVQDTHEPRLGPEPTS
jgi:hypothetical protein